jgi:hypothetical protein
MDQLDPLRLPDRPGPVDLVDPRCLDRLYHPFPQRDREAPEALEAPQVPETNRNHSIRASAETDNIFCMSPVLPFRDCVGWRRASRSKGNVHNLSGQAQSTRLCPLRDLSVFRAVLSFWSATVGAMAHTNRVVQSSQLHPSMQSRMNSLTR